MGRFAVPSALVIGSIVPDLWYFVPLAGREESHALAGLFWFCLPLGLVGYALFHLLVKHPLIALLPQTLSSRLGGFTAPALPAAPWHAVMISLLAGALTHIVWDALTHSNDHAVDGHNWLQHASTALGTAVLAWWTWRKLSAVPANSSPATLSPRARACILAGLVAATAISAWSSLDAAQLLATDFDTSRRALRSAAMAAVEGLCMAALVYCVFWRFRATRISSP
jgi:Domain of unknown function (DUF4184)